MRHKTSLAVRFPPSAPCNCSVCASYCSRPGWWTVTQARRALAAGLGNRMMLEISPDFSIGVLSPAFRGCEGYFALQDFCHYGCNFLSNGLCELHATILQPLECSYVHHERAGLGQGCHDALEADWTSISGQKLVRQWLTSMKLDSPLHGIICY